MKIDKKEKLEILSKYYNAINEQRGLSSGKKSKNPQQNTQQKKYVYKKLPATMEIQKKLKMLSEEIGNPNLDPGPIDGIFGDKSLRAFNTLAAIRDDIVVYSPMVTKNTMSYDEWEDNVKNN